MFESNVTKPKKVPRKSSKVVADNPVITMEADILPGVAEPVAPAIASTAQPKKPGRKPAKKISITDNPVITEAAGILPQLVEPAEPVAITATESSTTDVPSEAMYHMISEAAYYHAAQRGFEPGQELGDWFEAERQITGKLSMSPA